MSDLDEDSDDRVEIEPHLTPAQVCCCVIAQPTNERKPICLVCNYEILDPQIYVCNCFDSIPYNYATRTCSHCYRKRMRQDLHTANINSYSIFSSRLFNSSDKRHEE